MHDLSRCGGWPIMGLLSVTSSDAEAGRDRPESERRTGSKT